MGTQAKLFQSNMLPLDSQLEALQRQAVHQTKTCHFSFGFYKTVNGLMDHNAMVVITDNKGQHFNFSLHAENFTDLFSQISEHMEKLNK